MKPTKKNNVRQLSVYERAAAYNRAFPKYAPLNVWHGCIYGYWTMGNNFAGSGYYGSFPGNLLDRIMSLFPEIEAGRTLHLFSGSVAPGEYYRFDRKIVRDDEPATDTDGTNPIIVGEAEQLETVLWENGIVPMDLIIADPPYTGEDAHRYGTVLVNRQAVFLQAMKVLTIGGTLVWFDQVKPMYSSISHALIGNIGIDISTNHRVRGIWIFQKRGFQ